MDGSEQTRVETCKEERVGSKFPQIMQASVRSYTSEMSLGLAVHPVAGYSPWPLVRGQVPQTKRLDRNSKCVVFTRRQRKVVKRQATRQQSTSRVLVGSIRVLAFHSNYAIDMKSVVLLVLHCRVGPRGSRTYRLADAAGRHAGLRRRKHEN